MERRCNNRYQVSMGKGQQHRLESHTGNQKHAEILKTIIKVAATRDIKVIPQVRSCNRDTMRKQLLQRDDIKLATWGEDAATEIKTIMKKQELKFQQHRQNSGEKSVSSIQNQSQQLPNELNQSHRRNSTDKEPWRRCTKRYCFHSDDGQEQ